MCGVNVSYSCPSPLQHNTCPVCRFALEAAPEHERPPRNFTPMGPPTAVGGTAGNNSSNGSGAGPRDTRAVASGLTRGLAEQAAGPGGTMGRVNQLLREMMGQVMGREGAGTNAAVPAERAGRQAAADAGGPGPTAGSAAAAGGAGSSGSEEGNGVVGRSVNRMASIQASLRTANERLRSVQDHINQLQVSMWHVLGEGNGGHVDWIGATTEDLVLLGPCFQTACFTCLLPHFWHELLSSSLEMSSRRLRAMFIMVNLDGGTSPCPVLIGSVS